MGLFSDLPKARDEQAKDDVKKEASWAGGGLIPPTKRQGELPPSCC